MKKEIGKFFILCAFFFAFLLLGSAIESLMPLPIVLLGLVCSAAFGWAAYRFMVFAPVFRRKTCAASLRTVRSSRSHQARQAA